MSGVTRILTLADEHLETAAPELIKLIVKFTKYFKPDIRIHLGDLLHLDCISHHTKGQVRLREGKRLADAYRLGNEYLNQLDAACGKKCKTVYIMGNHDDWVDQLIEADPNGYEGLVEFADRLRMLERGYTVIPINQHYKFGKLHFIHGNQLANGSYVSQYHAKKAVELYNAHVVYGHNHTHQVYHKVTPFQEVWQATAIPMLGSVNPEYMKSRPSAWMNGFHTAYVMDNGNFNDTVIKIFNNHFCFEGKVF